MNVLDHVVIFIMSAVGALTIYLSLITTTEIIFEFWYRRRVLKSSAIYAAMYRNKYNVDIIDNITDKIYVNVRNKVERDFEHILPVIGIKDFITTFPPQVVGCLYTQDVINLYIKGDVNETNKLQGTSEGITKGV